MGIWSEFVKSTTPDVRINVSNLKSSTLEWIFSKGKADNQSFEELYPETATFNDLGNYFCDTAKIWGYMDEKDMIDALRDIATNIIDGDVGTLIFSSDADYVNYYMLRFDRVLKRCFALVNRKKKYPSNIDDIDWVLKSESEIFSEFNKQIEVLLTNPGLSASDRKHFISMLKDD